MKGKHLAILVVLALVLGGAWYLLSERNRASYSTTGGGGDKIVDFPINDVSQIVIKNATGDVHLVKKGDVWTVQERADYPANFVQVGDFLRKLQELKTVQTITVGESQMPRLELVEPGKGDKAGTLVQFLAADGKPLGGVLLGKKHFRDAGGDDGGGLGGPGSMPSGRYVKPLSGGKVSLVSESFEDAEPAPARWIEKDFIKIEQPKSVAVTGADDAHKWTVTRENATAEWKLAGAKEDEKVDAGKTSGLGTIFSSTSFTDVQSPDTKLEEPVTTAKIDTLDGFHYELKIGKAKDDNYPVTVKVTADLAKERTAGKDEKPEDKKKLDEDFAKKQKELQEKLDKEKKFEGRPYVIAKFNVDPLLKDRAGLLADKPAAPATPPSGAAPLPGGLPMPFPGAGPATSGAPMPPGHPPLPAPAPPKPQIPPAPKPAAGSPGAASAPVTATTPPVSIPQTPPAPAPPKPEPAPAKPEVKPEPAPAKPEPKPEPPEPKPEPKPEPPAPKPEPPAPKPEPAPKVEAKPEPPPAPPAPAPAANTPPPPAPPAKSAEEKPARAPAPEAAPEKPAAPAPEAPAPKPE